MATTIHSNGSKWAGESPDSIDKLLQVLADYPLDRRFEQYGDFAERCDTTGATQFFGNFLTVSHVFRIDSDDPQIVGPLIDAIATNKQRPDYVCQPNGDEPGDWVPFGYGRRYKIARLRNDRRQTQETAKEIFPTLKAAKAECDLRNRTAKVGV
jgi:hypothetical protein